MNLRSLWASLGIPKPVSDALEYIAKKVNFVFTRQHTPEGAHGAITATSVTSTGPVTGAPVISTQGIFERGRTVAMGDWQPQAFSAANFTGNGAMTWTVAVGNVVTNRFMREGSSLWWTLLINNSSVGGALNTQLLATLPAGLVAAATASHAVGLVLDNGVAIADAWIRTTAGSPQLAILKGNGAVLWTASAVNTFIQFTVCLEVQ